MAGTGEARARQGLPLVCAIVASACASADDPPRSTTAATFTTLSTSTTDGESTTDGGSEPTDGSGADVTSSTGASGPTADVTGVVIDFGTLNMPTIEGVTVALWGDPSTSTTTDSNGAFTLAVPAGEIAFIEIGIAGYWGALVRADVTAGDLDLGEINIANDTFILARVAVFENFDDTKAAVIGRSTATDTTLTLLEDGQPATADDEYFSIDAQTEFTLGDNVTRSAGFPAVVFFNLDDREAGALTMSASHPMFACSVAGPTPPVKGRTITWVEISCS
jgi:hypothetical protein